MTSFFYLATALIHDGLTKIIKAVEIFDENNEILLASECIHHKERFRW